VRAVDTNVLVRYMATDEPQQTRLAAHFIESCRRAQETIFIPILVLCELVWVLERSYRNSKTAIRGALDQILETDLLAIENDSLVAAALRNTASVKATLQIT